MGSAAGLMASSEKGEIGFISILLIDLCVAGCSGNMGGGGGGGHSLPTQAMYKLAFLTGSIMKRHHWF